MTGRALARGGGAAIRKAAGEPGAGPAIGGRASGGSSPATGAGDGAAAALPVISAAGPAGAASGASGRGLAAARSRPVRTKSRAIAVSIGRRGRGATGAAGSAVGSGSGADLSYPAPVVSGRTAHLGAAAALAAALAAVAPIACGPPEVGGGDAAPGERAQPVVFETGLIGEPVPPAERIRIELLEPGREPRRALRYRPAAGAEQRGQLHSEQVTEFVAAGRRLYSQKAPSTDSQFDIRVEAISGGRIDCSLGIDSIGTPEWDRLAPGRGEELQRSLSSLEGHRIRFQVDDRGRVAPLDLELPDEVGDARAIAANLVHGVTGSVVPLPEEPVGPGARWRVVEDAPEVVGVAGPTVSEYTLTAASGDRLEIASTMQLPTAPQPLQLTSRQLVGYSGGRSRAATTAVVDLRRVAALSLDMTLDIALEGRVVGDREIPFDATGVNRLTIRTR